MSFIFVTFLRNVRIKPILNLCVIHLALIFKKRIKKKLKNIDNFSVKVKNRPQTYFFPQRRHASPWALATTNMVQGTGINLPRGGLFDIPKHIYMYIFDVYNIYEISISI